jgi:hypothetical protein
MHRILEGKTVEHRNETYDLHMEPEAINDFQWDTRMITPTLYRFYAPTAAWQHRPEQIPQGLLTH